MIKVNKKGNKRTVRKREKEKKRKKWRYKGKNEGMK